LTSFFAIESYSPLLVLTTGLFTFIGLWGIGTTLLFFVRLRLPSPWSHVTAILLGIEALSLAVQIVSIAELASRLLLSTIWCGIVGVGAAMLLFRHRTLLTVRFSAIDKWALLPIAIAGTAGATNLLISLAPSTKIDELYYHMLVPSRIVSDGALRFYRKPWEGAIWPDMLYQISAAPVHAIGFPDAANVVSWGLSITLLWFAWRIIRANSKPPTWAGLWVASLCVGIYPAVWHVTGGAHAMGDLAMAAAIIAFCSREHLLGNISAPTYAAMLSILLLSAAGSKISLLPLCAVLLCLAAWSLLQVARPLQVMLALAAPWLVFFCPIAVWTWTQSGSPFGPVLAGVFGPAIYADAWPQDANQPPLVTVIQYISAGYSPLIWLGVIGAVFATQLSKVTRLTLVCLLLLQGTLIYSLLPHDARFLGGLQYGLLIAFAAFVARKSKDRLASDRVIGVASAIFLVPWLGIQTYYAKQFFPAALGQETDAFYKRYVAFYADYVKLDRLLSKDTVLLVQGFRLGAVYAPRPIFFDAADLPRGKQAVLFASPETIRAIGASYVGYKSGDLIYENLQAVTVTYRTPGKLPSIGALQVVKLNKD
jgi:hypothetical protein